MVNIHKLETKIIKGKHKCRSKFTVLIFPFISILFPNISITQTLDVLISEIQNQNLELKIIEKEYQSALEKAPQVSQLPDPEFGLGIFPLPVETRLGPQIFRLGGTQMFPWKGVLDSKKELELSKAKAQYERIAVRHLDLVYQLKKEWFRLYEIQKSQTVLSRKIEILEALENVVLAKIESGKASTADALRVQLKLKELTQNLEILNSKEAQPTIAINQILNRGLDTKINISDSLEFAELIFKKDTLLANIQANHPLIRIFELQQGISKKAMSVNELSNKPTFGAGADYIMVNDRKDAEPANNGRDIIQLRATVRIPINKQRFEAKDREETLKIEALEIQKENTVSQFSAMIEKAYAAHATARLKINLYEEQKKITETTIRILESEYSAKGNRFDELLRLETDLIQFDLEILKAVTESHLAKNEVERFIAN